MKRTIILSLSIILIILFSIFIYNRFKTKRIEHIIGANQLRVEEFINFPNERASLNKIDSNDLDDRIKEIIKNDELRTTQPFLRYTLNGDIRKLQFWLMDQGDGYYVIEAINTNK